MYHLLLLAIFMITATYLYTLIFGRKIIAENFRPFSYLDEDISQGVPVSLSDRPNQYGRQDGRFPESPDHVYFGTPNPLFNEFRRMKSPEDSMFYFKDFKCSPECCPSPYSCSGGCVCAFRK